MDDTMHGLKEDLHDGSDKVREAVDDTKNWVGDKADAARENLEEFGNTVRHKWDDTEDDLGDPNGPADDKETVDEDQERHEQFV